MSGEAAVVLSVHQLQKKIRSRHIIKGVSFDVRRGEIFGFLGPNGSGKTTTIRMLVGLIKPTSGSITLGGYDIGKKRTDALRHVGCIVENPEMYSYMTGWENLEHFARMMPGVDERRIREVTELVGLDHRIYDKVRTYSLGMRQRLGIAQALLGKPSLLILDEPTNGLDPQGIKEMRDFIRKLAAEGLSLFVSSHLLSEIQQLCDRVAIISHGTVIAVGAVDELLKQHGSTVKWLVEPHERALALIAQADGVRIVDAMPASEDGQAESAQGEADGQRGRPIIVQMEQGDIPALNERLTAAGVRLFGIETMNPTLEELFLRVTEGEHIE
ncbi:MAG: transporter ATP-binding protein [Paenibacillus sp.]|jgi:ABC-2 type transport system ATP-binding protein|nr:transporter ATP-binding protein [Paenibacillus sp.]